MGAAFHPSSRIALRRLGSTHQTTAVDFIDIPLRQTLHSNSPHTDSRRKYLPLAEFGRLYRVPLRLRNKLWVLRKLRDPRVFCRLPFRPQAAVPIAIHDNLVVRLEKTLNGSRAKGLSFCWSSAGGQSLRISLPNRRGSESEEELMSRTHRI